MTDSLEMAEQQLLGFAHARGGHSAAELVQAMGLTEAEWAQLHEDCLAHVSEADWQEIEDYFRAKREEGK